MTRFNTRSFHPNLARILPVAALTALGVGVASVAYAVQDKPGAGAHQHGAQTKDDKKQSLPEQLAELRAKVAKLESALAMRHSGSSGTGDKQSGGMGMGMGGMKSGGMGMGMGGMKPGGMGMHGRGMKMMGASKHASAATSALPGFPGMSHLYHVGAKEFFLDHAEHVALTETQLASLRRIREQAELDLAKSDRKVADAEQELWVLTSAAEPDADAIERKVRAIETSRGNQRLAFIRSVGEAAQLLTDAQRATLVGEAKAQHSNPAHQGR